MSSLAVPLALPPVYIVYLEFTARHRDSSLPVLLGFAARLFPACELKLVIVDNGSEHDSDVPRHPDATCIAGDNSSREFSGMDKGVSVLKSQGKFAPDAVVILANDTFNRNYGAHYLDHYQSGPVGAALASHALVGYCDGYLKPIELFGLPLSWWIRTSLVITTGMTLARLSPLAIPFPDEEIFAHDHQTFFRESAQLSKNYTHYLRTWLFGDEDPSGEFRSKWHSQRELNDSTFESFKGKARSILCEHYFSARARRLGVPLLDMSGRIPSLDFYG